MVLDNANKKRVDVAKGSWSLFVILSSLFIGVGSWWYRETAGNSHFLCQVWRQVPCPLGTNIVDIRKECRIWSPTVHTIFELWWSRYCGYDFSAAVHLKPAPKTVRKVSVIALLLAGHRAYFSHLKSIFAVESSRSQQTPGFFICRGNIHSLKSGKPGFPDREGPAFSEHILYFQRQEWEQFVVLSKRRLSGSVAENTLFTHKTQAYFGNPFVRISKRFKASFNT